MKILASEQVRGWLKALPPEPKRRVRLALRSLVRRGRGDVQPLEAELDGFCRLRVGGYRIVYSEQPGQVLRLEYADLREFVYERFVRLLKERID
jgi:mRNA-degrading endonuclease RelE of RelBE toxin-antitoxin system